MFDKSVMRRILRRTAIGIAAAVATLYIAVLVLLLTEQREMLFVRGRHARAPDAIYQVRAVTESDGTRIVTWQAAPPRPGAPVIAFFYGNAGTLSDFARIGEAFHDAGYGILLGSYRGYPGNSGEPSESGVMMDARAALATLPKGHGKVILWGQSLGTGVAARMASEGRGAALILQSPYTAIADVAARRFPIYPVHWLMYDRFDTYSLVPAITIPVLIMSGTADPVVPFDMGQTLATRFGRRATFVPFLGGDHNLPAAAVRDVAARWLQAHMPAQP